ncbi:O-antigen ligase family protein [Aridibaculum aurantiacum]|uniref:O-antigen ligase family protein n=1 Tax=Aridibaculum aurantiacum TaxID=2810307 RepID=UPI001A9725CF|nr:O-antigen ligase family protein [Aridibaculum aurantiacum]
MPHFIAAFIIGLVVGFKTLPSNIVGYAYMGIILLAFIRCLQGNVAGFLSVIPYAIYGEIFMRAFVKWVPYLTLQYSLIACFIVLIFRTPLQKCHFRGYMFLLLFTLLELANNVLPYKVDVSRAILVNSAALMLPVLWASYHPLKPVVLNRFINNVKIACLFLVGVVYVAHISGNIDYGGHSNSDASNGLAPVQLSGYIGVACSFFFFSIMNNEQSQHRWLNILVLGFCGTAMVLTFSRGGLYFLGVIVVMYLWYNRAKARNYALFILLVPVVLISYHFVVEQTQGKILERYQQEGSSNRDVLVMAGYKVFEKHPWIGVGTGNFNTVIVRDELFPVESGAHNEFIRAAAEHGIVGLILYWGFFFSLFYNISRRAHIQKQYAMYFTVLMCMIIIHNGLKISIQPFLLMLAVATPSLLPQKVKNVYSRTYQQRVTA